MIRFGIFHKFYFMETYNGKHLQAAPHAVVFYGQETGIKKESPDKPFDELGVLLPIHEFEKKMLQRMEEIDGIVLACRERMMEQAGNDSLKL